MDIAEAERWLTSNLAYEVRTVQYAQ